MPSDGLTSASVVDAEGTAEFAFDGCLRLLVRPPDIGESQSEDWWMLFGPERRVLTAMPGPTWQVEAEASGSPGP